MHFIISNDLYYTIEKIVFLNGTLGTIFLITLPLVSISLCINLSLYNKGEKKKVPIMFKFYYIIIFVIISIHVLYNINLKHTQTVLPEGELLNTYYSPDKKSMIKVYNLTYAVLDRLYRGCRIDSIDRSTWEVRRIYFNPEDNRPKIKWINNDNVLINDNKINIRNGYYNDYNNGK